MGSQAAIHYLFAAAHRATTSLLEQLAAADGILARLADVRRFRRAKLLPLPIPANNLRHACGECRDARRVSQAATGQSLIIDRRASRPENVFLAYCRSVASRLGTFV
jgi:hypothetical protein